MQYFMSGFYSYIAICRWKSHTNALMVGYIIFSLCLKDRFHRLYVGYPVLKMNWVFFYSFLLPPGTSNDSKQILLKILITSNVLFTRKPWCGRPSEPWPTTALHPTPTPYKHIRRCLQPSTFIGRLGGILGANVSSCQTIAFSTVHVWAHQMHRWTSGCDLGPFCRRKQHNKPLRLGRRY
jgi:hypothetical protein